MPDRLGQDRELAGTSLAETVMVYFPGTRDSLDELRRWYGPITALHEKHPVIVIFQDSRAAKIARAESGLSCVTIARYGAIDAVLSRSNVKLALYLDHSPQNFVNLRFLSLAHVYLGHSDSADSVKVSNQLKAYDFCFVAGQADVDRIAQYALLDDVTQRAIAIGRPQVDFAPASMAHSSAASRGDTTQGVATGRFIEACEHVMDIRDRAWAEVLARGRAGP